MRKIIFLLILINLAGNLSADQTGCVCGRVVDEKTKEPLIGVNILVLGTERGAVTDIGGRYRITGLEIGSYRLEYRFIGYQSVIKTDITANPVKSVQVNIEMRQQNIEVEGVTVSAGYFAESEKTRVSTTALIREEIRRFPGGFEDVVRTVSTLPGVAVNLSGGRNDLLVRGGGPSENLYLINNLEAPNINHFGTQGSASGSLSFVNLDLVEGVEFSSGGFSVRYGDKMSSVLELDLVNGRRDRFGMKGLVSATQFGVTLQGPVTEKTDYVFSARKSYLDLIFKASGLPFVPVYTDYNLIINHDFSDTDKLFFFSFLAVDKVDRDQDSQENRIVNSGIMDNTQNQWISGINYRHLIKKGYFDASYGVNVNQYRFSQADTAEIEYFKSEADEMENNLKFQMYRSIFGKFGIFNGFSYKNAYLDNQTQFNDSIYNRSGNKISIEESGLPQRINEKENFHKLSFFSEIEGPVLDRLELAGGVRVDHYRYLKDDWYVSPRVTLKYTVNPVTKIKLSGGYYYQSPSYVWVMNQSNRDLKALLNKMVILGMDRRLRDDVSVRGEIYYKDYKDLPTGTIAGVNDYFVLNNGGAGFGGREDDFQSFGYYALESDGKGKAYGAEIILQKKYSQIPLYGQMAVTLNKSEFTAGNGNVVPGVFDQRFIFNLSGGYKINNYWEISGKFRYFTGVPYTPVYRPSENPLKKGEIQNLPEEYLSDRLDAGHHLDLRIDRYFFWEGKEMIFFIDIQNIYNYKIPIKPRYDFWEDKVERENNIGILPSIGISFEF